MDYNLRIVCQENDIDMSGENKCAFTTGKRPVSLVLIDNKAFEYMDESIIGTFLKQNQLNEVITQIDCNDCRNVWLKGQEFETRADGMICENAKYFFDQDNFIGC